MRHFTGFLIRKHRLKQNLSQEGLCRGICAVSYLSKIEQGQVEPGQEIIDRLFAALGIVYIQDEAWVQGMRRSLHIFFERFFFREPTAVEQEAIDAQAAQMESSVLHIAYQIYRAYALWTDKKKEEALGVLEALSPFEGYMDTDTAFLYAYAQGLLSAADEAALAALSRAKALRPCSPVFAQEAQVWYHRGQYPETLTYIHQGLHTAMEEGNVAVMRELSYLEGCCYANLFNRTLMLQAFRRTASLSRGDARMQATIHYNIGAALVEMHRYEEALPYLSGAVDALRTKPEHYFLLCHKLIVACYELGRAEEGRYFLQEAEAALAAEADMPTMFASMLEIVRMRYAQGQMDSDAYLALLRKVYDLVIEETSFGFRQFHGLFLIEAYTRRRKYKEALAIAKEVNWPFS